MSQRRLLAILRLALVTAGLLLFAAGARAADGWRIGVSGPFTGGSAPMGLSMRDGIRLAAAEINAAGGILGEPLVLIERDDESRPELGVRIAQDFVVRANVVAVVGIVNTGVALASQRIYQNARLPMLTAVATGTIITKQFHPPQYADNYIFRVSVNDSIQAEMIVAEAVDKRRFTRLAILHDSTNYGLLGREDLEAALARRGLKPVLVERFDLRGADMTKQVSRARAADAQALLTYGIGPELASIANVTARLGWSVPLIGSWTLSMSNFLDNAGPNAEGARMPQTMLQEPQNARQRSFIAAWRKAYGPARIASPSAAAQAYDALMMLAAALRQSGTRDGSAIRAALENLQEPIDGVVQRYERPFSHTDHEAIDSAQVPVLGEVRNGKVVSAYGATPHGK
ncbi:MAG: ABC transporter substrate-binding protein [Rhodocyclaceae bacterium]|nr:ABC transporter substrate-binding protein [Rhodocyclaceae bacterium]MBX3667101.1 ABC transporter substrate-binding protein [Rhodocyclaceae bacterium]